MGPFETHPASPHTLRARARALQSLAEEAADLDALTQRAFHPATAAWDGVAAPELREAPQPVRERAQEVTSQLAWAAVPLRYWADRVSTFDAEARRLRQRFDAVPGEVDIFLASYYGDRSGPGAPPDYVVEEHRASEVSTRRGRLRQEWQDAHEKEILRGSQDAAAMFRDGPTWQHQALANEVGAIPSSGMFPFLAARWERAEAPAEALHLAQLINEPGYRPTAAELARLEHLLTAYAEDEAFAYHLLTDLGQEGLVSVYGNIALLQPDGNYGLLDSDLAGTQAAIQAGLATALATATARRGTGGGHPYAPYHPGEYELGPDWVAGLLAAGRQTFEISMPYVNASGQPVPGMNDLTIELYGYQLIGGLLGAATVPFDADLLHLVGGDMIHFEQTVGWSRVGGDGVPIWYDSWYAGNGVPGGTPLRLTWVNGFDGDADAGFDPMHGLMNALHDNPEATRQLLTSQVRYDGTEGGRLPLVDYLLTERVWMADYAGHYYYEGAQQHLYHPDWGRDWSLANPGHALLGEVLAGAVNIAPGDPVDERSVRILESIVFELNHDWPQPGRDDMIPSAMRGSIAGMFDNYIVDINRAVGDHELGIPHRDVSLGKVDVENLLRDIGRDSEAQATVRTAQHAYTATHYHYYLTGEIDPDSSLALRLRGLDQVSLQNGRVLAALDQGVVSHEQLTEEERLRELLRRREEDRAWFQVLATGTSHTLLAAAPTPGFVDEAVKTAIASAFHAAPEPSLSPEEANSIHVLTEELTRMLDANAEQAKTSVEHAAYDSGALTELPSRFVNQETGKLHPREDWDELNLETAWARYLDTAEEGSMIRERASDARTRYESSYSWYTSLPGGN